jgi:deazaflavin-dependent oxidoreductase (nitroreductase family)
MPGFESLPKPVLRLLRQPPRLAYAVGLGPLLGRMVLLLTTTGRKSGLPRVTPLQYEEVGGLYYLGSARGQSADWFRNILANPHVEVRLKDRRFSCLARPVTDPQQIADFLQLRLARHPRMVTGILKRQGLPAHPSREQLENYASQLALVILDPASCTTENHQTKHT